MRVLLINPPMDITSPPRFISFGIAYITQEIKSGGYDAEILDIDGHRYSKSEVSEFIKNASFDVVAIGGLVTIYPYLSWLVPEIRRLRPGIEIILGGGIASSMKEKCFERFDIDYEIIGEGEITIIELLGVLKENRDFSSVKGIGYRSNGKVVFTDPRSLMPSLDKVPQMDDSLFPMERLLENSYRVMQVHTQRGCPYQCGFCFNCYRVVSNKVRYRPVGNVIDEIESLNDKYDVQLFALSGELVMMSKEWIIEFCKEVLRRKLKIKYRVTSRATTVDEERLSWLKRSGCDMMSLGLESGSNKILKLMKKGTTVEQGRKAVVLAVKYIPNLEISMMMGYLEENEETLKESVSFFKEIGVKPIMFLATPFPGTEIYREAIRKGRIKDEEEYLMKLDDISIFDLSTLLVNLTDMPDDVARSNIRSAISEIENYYFYRDLWTLRLFRRGLSSIKKIGFRDYIIYTYNKLENHFESKQ